VLSRGTPSRTVTAQPAGTAVVTVTTIAPASPLVIGLGKPRADGSGCLTVTLVHP
jgi:hypothetical protein